MQTKDYFIKDSGISAYTINAFVEAIVEATKAGYSIDYNSARRIGTSFSVTFFAQSKEEIAQAQEEPTGETQAPAQEEAPESPEESQEEPTGEPEQSPAGQTEQPFTVEDIEQAKNSMVELNKLAEPVGISGRSKKDVEKQLKEYIGA